MHQPLTLAALLVILAHALLSTPASAQIYRWVDANGKVHFSDTKPAGEASQKVDINAPPVGDPQDEGELRRLKLLERAEEDWQMRRETENEQAAAAVQQETTTLACKQARIDYGVLHEQMPVYRTVDNRLRPDWMFDHYTGLKQYIADADRPAEKQAALNRMAQHCAKPGDQAAFTATYDAWVDQEYCHLMNVELATARQPKKRTPKDKIDAMAAEYAAQCS